MICDVSLLVRDTIDQAPAMNLVHVGDLLSNMSLELRYVERSKLIHAPWSMVKATEEFLKRNAGTNSHFILRPQWSQNYGLISEFVKVYEKRLDALDWIDEQRRKSVLKDVYGENIYCISFPRLERLNALLHANLGHELGHVIAQRWVDSNFWRFWQIMEKEAEREIRKELTERWSGPEGELFTYILERQISDETTSAMNVAMDALKELISDAVGVHLLGPAALSAAVDFSSFMPLDDNPLDCGNYPPWRYRLRKMFLACKYDLEACRKEEESPTLPVQEAIEAYVDWVIDILKLADDKQDWDSLNATATTRIPYKGIEDSWDKIRKEAVGLLPGKPEDVYRLSKRLHDIAELVERLQKDIPPNETGCWPNTQPAVFEDILNAAWVFKIWKVREGNLGQDTEDNDTLYRLVLKAIETSQVQRTFGKKLVKLENN